MIYMDNAATTPVKAEVLAAMLPYMDEYYANPSAVYRFAGDTAKAVRASRESLGAKIGALTEEIYFTSGGSESDNWALFSVCEERAFKDCHIITSQIEHHAVLNTCKRLEKLGVRITYVPVLPDGIIDISFLEKSISSDTVMISVMAANNEIGTIEPIADIGAIAHEHNVLFHTDAVQAFGHIPIDVAKMNIDMLSASAHKLGGPKGVGLMYVRKGLMISPFISGGSQERGRRAGTTNAPGIVGFGAAGDIAFKDMDRDREYVSGLRDRLIRGVLTSVPDSRINGSEIDRLPGNVNFCFEGIEGETLLILLDRDGICASSGSACTTGAVDPSHVLMAIGRTRSEAKGSLRLTLSSDNTAEEVDEVIEKIQRIVAKLRSMTAN
ncbi:MAG: cysteine desulfurase NifS [Lachnospiraceae bacterium]|nr:cysteine desulfurase NifS [Lachnospiraceae bacterium]